MGVPAVSRNAAASPSSMTRSVDGNAGEMDVVTQSVESQRYILISALHPDIGPVIQMLADQRLLAQKWTPVRQEFVRLWSVR